MGWSKKQPTGYWLAWQKGLRGIPPRFKAETEQEVREQYKAKYGYEPDFCEQEFD